MKIDDLLKIVISPAASTCRRPPEDFRRYLSAAIDGRTPAGGTPEALPLSGPGALSPPGPERPAAALEAGLRRLEAFARGLADPGVTLRDLEPLAQELLQDSHRLAALARNLAADSPLRGLAEETAALAYVESLKFQRGDYLPG